MTARPTPAGGATRAPVGEITRGTTHPNRLRRVDAWVIHRLRRQLVASVNAPVAVDLGFGASPVTTVEWARRLHKVRPDVDVIGVEIDPERVQRAQPWSDDRITFVRGGFDLALPMSNDGTGQQQPLVIRAFNVLRQYDEADVVPAWNQMAAALGPDGVLVDGTCDELGRRATWVSVGADCQPHSLTFAARLASLDRPSDFAERLPKALIHRNVPGESIYDFLRAWDQQWANASGVGVFGARQRWIRTAQALRDLGWPLLDGVGRWRLGELSIDWSAVAPASPGAGLTKAPR